MPEPLSTTSAATSESILSRGKVVVVRGGVSTLCVTADGDCAGGRGYIAASHPLVDKGAGDSGGGAAYRDVCSARLIRYWQGLKCPYKARECGHMLVYRVVCLDKAAPSSLVWGEPDTVDWREQFPLLIWTE